MSDNPVQNPYTTPETGNGLSQVSGGLSLAKSVQVGQIITGSLVMGIVMMGGIFSVIMSGGSDQPADGAEPDMLFPMIGVGFAFMGLMAAFVLSRVLRAKAIHDFQSNGSEQDAKLNPDQIPSPAAWSLLSSAAATTLVGQALCEGPAVMNLVLGVVGGQWLIHGSVAGVMALGVLVQVPTIQRRQALLDEAASRM